MLADHFISGPIIPCCVSLSILYSSVCSQSSPILLIFSVCVVLPSVYCFPLRFTFTFGSSFCFLCTQRCSVQLPAETCTQAPPSVHCCLIIQPRSPLCGVPFSLRLPIAPPILLFVHLAAGAARQVAFICGVSLDLRRAIAALRVPYIQFPCPTSWPRPAGPWGEPTCSSAPLGVRLLRAVMCAAAPPG